MFEKFRQKPTPTIPYNETVEYRYLEVKGVMGLYTAQPISVESLPAGYCAFSLVGEPVFERILPAPSKKGNGIFVCKEQEANGLGRSRLSSEDCVFQSEKSFGWYEFREFFGQSITFDSLIKGAEVKREAQFAPKPKSSEKQNNSDF